MSRVGFESTVPASARAKAIHALDHSVIVTGYCLDSLRQFSKALDEADKDLVWISLALLNKYLFASSSRSCSMASRP
jgi:hypothetical protein